MLASVPECQWFVERMERPPFLLVCSLRSHSDRSRIRIRMTITTRKTNQTADYD